MHHAGNSGLLARHVWVWRCMFYQSLEDGGQFDQLIPSLVAGGGLLASLPESATAECIQRLHAAGYSAACLIGHVTPGQGRVRLL